MLLPAIQKVSPEKALILGPCSAETAHQMDEVAQSIHPLKPDFLRAGVWKPRTRPGNFQGMGEAAIPWLQEVREKYGLKICTEVATPEHVEIALHAKFDALWIGARTTVNPFYVQSIADALNGVDIPIFVKNPINPDLFLWLGAIERLMQTGIQRISAIHRGFSFYGNSIYRNIPRWQIPIELKRRIPELQMIADISHISGTPGHLLEIAQIAYDLNYDGLMAEVHPNPEEAWSDADQQVTADYLKREVLDKLITRKLRTDDLQFNQIIEKVRNDIDEIDSEIVKLLAQRMRLAEHIGEEKKQKDISIFQPQRWDDIIKRMLNLAKELNLSEEFIFSLIEAIHIESIQHQSKKMNVND